MVSSFKKKIIKIPITRNGPKGIIFSLCLNNKSNDTGSAIKLAIIITNKERNGSNVTPDKIISLTSAPPRHSFLKINSPNFIIKYIIKKHKNPLNIDNKNAFVPRNTNFIIKIRIIGMKINRSGIIK